MIGRARAAGGDSASFDRVEVSEEDGRTQSLDRAQFQALKLDLRVRYILGKRLRFFLNGQEVPLKEALASLR